MTDLARTVERLQDATVRDLAWLLFTPDLLCAANVGATLAHPGDDDATLAWLLALDAHPEALHAHARNPKHTRLGKYAESLLEFFLTHGPALRLVAANVPLRQGRRTIGECDFLLEDASGARLHWELAVKFYLHIGDGHATIARLSDYVGPNLQDRFDLKVTRLLTHQLGLTMRPEFAALGLAGPWEPQAYIKGRLFYHGDDTAPAPELGARHLRGWWMTASEWRASHERATRGRAWIVQPRMAWLSARRLLASEAASLQADTQAIQTRLQSMTTPTMVAVYAPEENNDDAWFEESRGFIVPDDWPERARAFAATAL